MKRFEVYTDCTDKSAIDCFENENDAKQFIENMISEGAENLKIREIPVTYQKIEFNSNLAKELDIQYIDSKFIELWDFMYNFKRSALIEWCEKRNFDLNKNHVVSTLKSLKILL